MDTEESPRLSAEAPDDKKAGFTIDNFPVKLREECKKVAFNRGMTLTQFTAKWMQFGLKKERKILDSESKKQGKE